MSVLRQVLGRVFWGWWLGALVVLGLGSVGIARHGPAWREAEPDGRLTRRV